ncbi:NUDIX domain-containing protein [Streptosporangium sp. NPDC000095]|uniref:NUDIX domain-containing protein n=1 Tax=Streptosporangium sp. NPDC000095 TaxID=3366184 RepID=UPI0036C06AA5
MISADTRPIPQQGPYGCAVTAHLLVLDEAGRWLLLRTARDHTRWQLPGGRVRRGESPATAAHREAVEETGLLGLHAERLLAVAWIPAGSDERHDRIAFVFSTRLLRAEDLEGITVDAREIDTWCLSAPPQALEQLHPLLAERLDDVIRCGPGRYLDQDPASRHNRAMRP